MLLPFNPIPYKSESEGGGVNASQAALLKMQGVYSSMTFDSIPPLLFVFDYLPHKITPN